MGKARERADDTMQTLPVSWDDGPCRIIPPDGQGRPFLQANRESLTLPEGWRPIHAVRFDDDLTLLELAHVAGARATWFFNRDLIMIANQFGHLPPPTQHRLRMAIPDRFTMLWDNVVCSAYPDLPEPARVLSRISTPCLQQALIADSLTLPEMSATITDLRDTKADHTHVINIGRQRIDR